MGKAELPSQEQLALVDIPAPNDQFRGQKTAKTQKKRTLNLEDLIRAADDLSDEDLQQLQGAIAAMLEIRGMAESDQEPINQDDRANASKRQRGSIEEKWINGCGPYRYLRWWSGGKHRSTYLGKVQKEESGVTSSDVEA